MKEFNNWASEHPILFILSAVGAALLIAGTTGYFAFIK